jgi:hypothetical protein
VSYSAHCRTGVAYLKHVFVLVVVLVLHLPAIIVLASS